MEVDAQISDRDQKEFSTTNIIKQNQKQPANIEKIEKRQKLNKIDKNSLNNLQTNREIERKL